MLSEPHLGHDIHHISYLLIFSFHQVYPLHYSVVRHQTTFKYVKTCLNKCFKLNYVFSCQQSKRQNSVSFSTENRNIVIGFGSLTFLLDTIRVRTFVHICILTYSTPKASLSFSLIWKPPTPHEYALVALPSSPRMSASSLILAKASSK